MELKTERLIIKEMDFEHLNSVHKYLKDEETMRFFVEGTYSLEQVNKVIESNQKNKNKLVVILKETNEVIGHISFNKWGMKDTYEIGWIFNKAFHSHGYATEAAKAVVNYTFTTLKAHRLVATCQPENTASIRLMEKLNMRLEGNNLKCIHYMDDVWWDELFYAILDEEYKQIS